MLKPERVEFVLHRLQELYPQLNGLGPSISEILKQNIDQHPIFFAERIDIVPEEALQQEIQDGTDSPHSGTRNTLEDIERTQITAEERLERARMQVQLLENELASGRRDLEVLDDMLMDLLEEQER